MTEAKSNALVAVLHTEQLALNADLEVLSKRMEADSKLLDRLSTRRIMVQDMLREYAEDIEHPSILNQITIASSNIADEPLEKPKPSPPTPGIKAAIRKDPQAVIDRVRAGKPAIDPLKKVDVDPEKPPVAEDAPPKKIVAAVAPPFVPTDDGRREFAHGSKMVRLSVKEWRVVAQLYHVMGRGFLPYNSIVENALKGERKPPDVRIWCSDMMVSLQDRMTSVGLEIREYPRQGYTMRELEA